MAFQHIPSEVGAVEAEEVGVEHLLRDIHDPSVSTMGSNVNAKLLALKSLVEHLKEVQAYLNNVCEGKLPINQKIVGQLQDIFNLLPNLNVEEMIRSFAVKTNDMMMVIYLSSLIRSIIALHNLINNKVPLLVSLCSCLCSSRSLPFRSVLTVRSSLSLDRADDDALLLAFSFFPPCCFTSIKLARYSNLPIPLPYLRLPPSSTLA